MVEGYPIKWQPNDQKAEGYLLVQGITDKETFYPQHVLLSFPFLITDNPLFENRADFKRHFIDRIGKEPS